MGAKFVMIIGEDEVKNDIVILKSNATKEDYKIEIENLISLRYKNR
ncbi:MAG: His/Gly/Thr/Pro-type tRNA ligase C-terminal domain-containing protein [Bacilli bacterium]